MSSSEAWMGRPIDAMTREELAAALKSATRILRSTGKSLAHPDLEVRETPAGTVIGRTFNWAFIPAGHLWLEADRVAMQSRLDEFAARRGLQGAVVRFDTDRLDVEVPGRLQVEQVMALQEWLEAEKEMLDVSQVP
jgi:hypothetical protein